jgi:hypothetical protein
MVLSILGLTYDDEIIGVSNQVEDNLNFVEFWSQSKSLSTVSEICWQMVAETY